MQAKFHPANERVILEVKRGHETNYTTLQDAPSFMYDVICMPSGEHRRRKLKVSTFDHAIMQCRSRMYICPHAPGAEMADPQLVVCSGTGATRLRPAAMPCPCTARPTLCHGAIVALGTYTSKSILPPCRIAATGHAGQRHLSHVNDTSCSHSMIVIQRAPNTKFSGCRRLFVLNS
jgi:hypothetical protein